MASRRDFGVEPLGPTRRDPRRQTRDAQGFGVEHFTVDWQRRRALCPAGHLGSERSPRTDVRGNAGVYMRFKPSGCGPCPSRRQCTRSTARYPRRSIAVRPQGQSEALRQRRALAATSAYAHAYARRAGIEGTLSQGVRRRGLRRSRYCGLARTHLGHVLTAAALHFARVADWLAGTPRAGTRHSPFANLMAQL